MALGLRCCAQAFSGCGVRAPHGGGVSCCGLWGCWLHWLQRVSSVVVARGLQSAGSAVLAQGLSCPGACGTFSDQGSNPCSLRWHGRQVLNHWTTGGPEAGRNLRHVSLTTVDPILALPSTDPEARHPQGRGGWACGRQRKEQLG